MMKPAFSTVACPEWTLAQVAERAQACGFEAVELRTFGEGSRHFACDPALTAGDKVRRIFGERGIEILSLATGVRFDEPVFPPVIGHAISDTEQSVREGKRAIDLAVSLECPLVRVFGFEFPAVERRARAIARIADRLSKVVDHADKTGVKVVVENGGSFATAAEVAELLSACPSAGPLLGVCYSAAVGHAAGDRLDEVVTLLGDRLLEARIKDLRRGRPCALGQGEVPVEKFVRSLRASGFGGPLVFEWDRAWNPELAPAEQVLGESASTIWGWLGGTPGAARGMGFVAAAGAGPRSR